MEPGYGGLWPGDPNAPKKKVTIVDVQGTTRLHFSFHNTLTIDIYSTYVLLTNFSLYLSLSRWFVHINSKARSTHVMYPLIGMRYHHCSDVFLLYFILSHRIP